jgi:nucleoid-associated protein YgaU
MMAKDDQPRADFSDVQSGSSSTAPQANTATARTYTVKKGDSLSKIAKREYGDPQQWHRIFEANRDTVNDPDRIFPGQVLRLPTA